MTNKEFYRDELMAIALEPKCYSLYKMVHGEGCTALSCRDCEFGYTEEAEEGEIKKILQWLNAEHEEPETPLLENGDVLNPGDWLEIEDDNDGRWYKGRFIGYLDGRFYVKHEGDQNLFGVSSSVHARLLEDGE